MHQYLIQWASGAFQIMTLDQLNRELDEWKQSPPVLYRLIPNQPPKRYWIIWGKNKEYWYLEDQYRNHVLCI